jgi:hypothetical protein
MAASSSRGDFIVNSYRPLLKNRPEAGTVEVMARTLSPKLAVVGLVALLVVLALVMRRPILVGIGRYPREPLEGRVT